MTPHEAPHLPLAVLHQFTNLRGPGAGGSEDDHAQVQLTPTVPLTAALTLLKTRIILEDSAIERPLRQADPAGKFFNILACSSKFHH